MSFCQILREFFPAHEMVIAWNGNKRIIVHKSQARQCMDCTNWFVLDDISEDSAGNHLCPSCRPDWYICDDCGEFTAQTTTVEGEQEVCDECLRNYTWCQFCETYSLNGRIDSDQVFACDSCLDSGDIVECECCNCFERYSETYNTRDNYNLCSYCFENRTTTCENCGEVYYSTDDFEEDDSGCYCCVNCLPQVIHEYNYKPFPIFLKVPGENTDEFFGLEIEVCGDRNYAKEYQEIIGEAAYLKKDGSVPGFEIVTHPMTRSFFNEEFRNRLRIAMDFLKKKQFSAHNRAGIHIHVSTKAISSEMLKRIVDLLYQVKPENQDIWRQITQRKQFELDRWASMKLSSLVAPTKKEVIKTIDYFDKNSLGKPVIGDTRYTALNTRNKNTVEFRMFNSNLRIERIAKNLQVVYSVLDFSKGRTSVCLRNYLDFVFRHRKDYPDLCAFLVEKNIYNPKNESVQLSLDLEDNDNEREIA